MDIFKKNKILLNIMHEFKTQPNICNCVSVGVVETLANGHAKHGWLAGWSNMTLCMYVHASGVTSRYGACRFDNIVTGPQRLILILNLRGAYLNAKARAPAKCRVIYA